MNATEKTYLDKLLQFSRNTVLMEYWGARWGRKERKKEGGRKRKKEKGRERGREWEREEGRKEGKGREKKERKFFQ